MHNNSQPNLANIKQQIDNWRNNKKHGSSKIPEEIKAAITKLTPQHSISKICKVFKISGSQFKSFKKNQLIKYKHKQPNKTKQIFKKIMLPISNTYNATIENNNGCKLMLQIPSMTDLSHLISNFIGGSRC